MKNMNQLIKKVLKPAKKQSGYGLSNIIVAISVLCLGSSVSAAYLDDALAAARDAQRMGNIRQVQTALNIYYDDNLSYPLSKSVEPTAQAWQEMKVVLEESQYMPEVPEDPLDEGEYKFKYWSDGQIFKLVYETEDLEDKSPRIAWGL